MLKTLHGTASSAAIASGLVGAILIWLWTTSIQGKAYLTLAVLWCCDADPAATAIILNHDPALVAAAACGVTISCIVTACWLLLHPGEKNPGHIKYDILHGD